MRSIFRSASFRSGRQVDSVGPPGLQSLFTFCFSVLALIPLAVARRYDVISAFEPNVTLGRAFPSDFESEKQIDTVLLALGMETDLRSSAQSVLKQSIFLCCLTTENLIPDLLHIDPRLRVQSLGYKWTSVVGGTFCRVPLQLPPRTPAGLLFGFRVQVRAGWHGGRLAHCFTPE